MSARVILVLTAASAVFHVGCKTSAPQREASPAVSCPAGYYYSPTRPSSLPQNNQTSATGTSTGSTGTSNSGGYGNYGNTYLTQSVVTWQNVQPIINAKCVSCHNASNPGGGIDVSSYAVTKSVGARVVDSVMQARMPLPKGVGLPQNERQVFQAWQNGNFLEFANTGTTGGVTTTGTNTGSTTGGLGQSTSTTGGFGQTSTSGTGSTASVPAGCYPIQR
jgi:hypothetical protein